MLRPGLSLAVTALVGSLLAAQSAIAQLLPAAEKARRVEIIHGPVLELAFDHLAILRWTTTNPGGSDVHFGVVNYGTDPKNLDQMATSPLRLNRGHPEAVFRVRLAGLTPRTTYYFKVTSIGSGGTSDGVESAVTRFATPGPGERVVAYPPW